MDSERLIWHELENKTRFDARIFSVSERICRSPQGGTSSFSIIETHDWAVVIPLVNTEKGKAFLMVRQWRHGAKEISLEFPGGVIESGETFLEGAARELREETGYKAGKLTQLGQMSPNPAIMANRVHFFLAEELCREGELRLDKDEYVEVEKVNVDDVIKMMGRPPYIHALMASALCFYMQRGQANE
jgi:8-oxo-dGTP pyrophosphatase MutT (NUDIX family)